MGSLRSLKTEHYLARKKERYKEQQHLFGLFLEEACNKNDPALVRKAIKRGADINFLEDDDELTPFSWCYEIGSYRVLHTMITYGNLKLNQQDPALGTTPLHRAVEMAHYGVIRQLIRLGADITIRSKFGRTPLEEVRECLTCEFDPDDETDMRDLRKYQLCERILLKAEEKAKK